MPPSTDRPIYHFTDYQNIPGIVDDGGLYSDTKMLALNRTFVECAAADIKDGRRNRAVTAPPYGCVGDYVPFYYATRSPMMSAISNGQVAGYTSSKNLVYLATWLSVVDSAGLPWVCSDGNARAGLTDFFNTWDDLESQTDWDVMKARYWFNTDTDGDRRRRRMAEFLVHDFVLLTLIRAVAVYSERIAEVVQRSLPQLEVQVQPNAYI